MKTREAAKAETDDALRGMRVLVAVDGSAPAVRACEMLTHLLPARTNVRLLTVLSYSDYPFSLCGGSLSDEDERIHGSKREVALAQREAKGVLERAGFDVTVVHRYGYPSDEIVSELDDHGADLVVLGSRKLHGPARWIGSTSDRVIHQVHIPVLLVA